MGIPGRINAAPAGPEDECGYDAQMGLGPSTAPTEGVESSYAGTALLKPDLLSTLRGHFGGNTAPDGSNEGGGGRAAEENAAENGNGNGTKSAAKGKKGDDYEAYLRAVGDLI